MLEVIPTNMLDAIPGAPNFTWAEFFRSQTAKARNIDNTPKEIQVFRRLHYLVITCLQPAREALGNPMRINSGYRGPALNKAVGGSATSFHSYGMAADCEMVNVPNMALFCWFYRNVPFTELIAEECSPNDPTAGWVHIAIQRDREEERKTKFKLPGQPVRTDSFENILKTFKYTER